MFPALFVVASCGSGGAGQVGQMELALTAESGDATYRLRDATFHVLGPESAVLESANPNVSVLTEELFTGAYTIELQPGWRMERSEGGGSFEEVDAVLLSPNPVDFSVAADETTSLTYFFRVPGQGDVGFTTGDLEVGIGVTNDCDPLEQSGCAAGEKCTSLLLSGATGESMTGCSLDGTIPEGGACTRSVGADDCVAGTVCSDGACASICDVDESVADCICLEFVGLFDDSPGTGVCEEPCDLLAQDCPAQEGCYLVDVLAGESVCAPAVGVGDAPPGMQGDPCQQLNTCAPGYGCVVDTDPSTPEGTCTFFCDAEGSTGPSCADGPGSGFTCLALVDVFPDADVSGEVGICLDCAENPDLPGCS